MNSFFRFALALFSMAAATVIHVFGATPPPGVQVTYAFVPKEQLSNAVKGKEEALAIQAAWRKEAMARTGLPGYPINLGNTKYSTVVFVEIPGRFALWGKIGIPVQHPKI